jgi:hypothetical protein
MSKLHLINPSGIPSASPKLIVPPNRRNLSRPVRFSVFGGVLASLLLTACNADIHSAGGSSPDAKGRATSNSSAEKVATPAQKDSAAITSGEQLQSHFVLGSPAPGLNFSVESTPIVQPQSPAAQPLVPSETLDQTKAISAFASAVVKDDYQMAFGLLTEADRAQIGSPAKFGEVLAKSPSWISFSIETVTAQSRNSVTTNASELNTSGVVLTVRQQPGIDETRGVVGPTARVEFSMRTENGGSHVVWRRHTVTQNFVADETELLTDVGNWVEGRRACLAGEAHPRAQYEGGLVGEVWLAKTLCQLPSKLTVENVGDFDSLIDPQAIVDAFGPDAYRWARVVKVNSPNPFYAIAAPLGDHWVVVGLSSNL